jgi:outer membrane protein TolC
MQRILVGILSLLCCLGSITHAAEEKMAVADLSHIKVLDLPTAQSLALAGNPNMEAAQARVDQAQARVRQL